MYYYLLDLRNQFLHCVRFIKRNCDVILRFSRTSGKTSLEATAFTSFDKHIDAAPFSQYYCFNFAAGRAEKYSIYSVASAVLSVMTFPFVPFRADPFPAPTWTVSYREIKDATRDDDKVASLVLL